MDHKEYRAAIRQMLDHENTLINSRYTWMLATQSLLFAALGTFWLKDLLVEVMLCGVGMASTSSVGYSLYSANRSVRNLIEDWENYCNGNPAAKNLPRIYGLRNKWPEWPYPWKAFPPVLLVAWIVLLIRRLLLV